MFGLPHDEETWAYCPTCCFPAYRNQVGQQCPVCDDHERTPPFIPEAQWLNSPMSITRHALPATPAPA